MLLCASRIVFTCALSAVILIAVPAAAATFNVNSTTDGVDVTPGDGICATAGVAACTLRAAIQEANSLGGADTITLPAGTYPIGASTADQGEDASVQGDLDVNSDIIITGAGAAVTTVDAQGFDRVLHLLSGVLTVQDLTLTGGSYPIGDGGGIYTVGGTLTVQDVILTGNMASEGPAYYHNGGTALLERVSMTGNGDPLLTNNTVVIINTGTLTIQSSTISGNNLSAGTLAAFWSAGGTTTILNSTIHSGTKRALRVDGDVTLRNSLLVSTVDCQINSFPPDFTDGGGNFSAGSECDAAGDPFPPIPNTAAAGTLLEGLTQDPASGQYVHRPLAGNPVIDSIAGACPATTDQRGVARPQSGNCDSGAVEIRPVAITSGAPPNGVTGTPYTHTFTACCETAFSYAVSAGTLPAGLSLSAAGVLSGTPLTEGAFAFTVQGTDGIGQVAAQASTGTIAPGIVPTNPSPAISGLPPAVVVEENRTLPPLPFMLLDDATAPDSLAVSVAVSGDPVLAALRITGSGAARALAGVLADDREGVATIALTVSDGSLSSTAILTLTVVPAPPPAPPTDFTGVIDGDQVIFTWQAPATGAVPTFYVIEGGTSAGTTTLPVVNTRSRATTYRAPLPPGTYFFRARAGNSGGISAPTGDITGTVMTADVPRAPTGLVSSVDSTLVSLSWQPAPIGAEADVWRVEVGSAPGLANLAVLTLPAGTTAVSGALPAGAYAVRVRGANASGLGPASNGVRFVVGGTPGCVLDLPDAPVLLPATVTSERLVTLTWRAPVNAAVQRYRILVGTAPELSNLLVQDAGPATSLATFAPPGRYYVAVVADNACGSSGASNTVLVEVQ